MRIASRVIGVALSAAGLAFFALIYFILGGSFDQTSVLVRTGPHKIEWIAAVVCAGLAICFLLAGWHYLRLDLEKIEDIEEQPFARLAPYFVAHRRELRLIAQAGLAFSLIRIAAACFGVDWPGRWAVWLLVLAAIGLFAVETQMSPEGNQPVSKIRKVMEPWIMAALPILVALFSWSRWSEQKPWSRIANAALIAVIWGREAAFFSHGETRNMDAPKS
jgi:MFS family permease